MNRSYWTGRFDLADLNLHNAIEHDASLTRRDAALVPDQGKPDLELVRDLLNEATGTMPDGSPRLTIPDLSRALSKRRVDSRKANKDYTETFTHNVFGSSKCVLFLPFVSEPPNTHPARQQCLPFLPAPSPTSPPS